MAPVIPADVVVEADWRLLQAHLGADDLADVVGIRSGRDDQGRTVFETPSGAVYFLHLGAAWRFVRLADADEVTCWRRGREVGRVEMAPGTIGGRS